MSSFHILLRTARAAGKEKYNKRLPDRTRKGKEVFPSLCRMPKKGLETGKPAKVPVLSRAFPGLPPTGPGFVSLISPFSFSAKSARIPFGSCFCLLNVSCAAGFPSLIMKTTQEGRCLMIPLRSCKDADRDLPAARQNGGNDYEVCL